MDVVPTWFLRNPAFTQQVLHDHSVRACKTSNENGDSVPLTNLVRLFKVEMESKTYAPCDLGAFQPKEPWAGAQWQLSRH